MALIVCFAFVATFLSFRLYRSSSKSAKAELMALDGKVTNELHVDEATKSRSAYRELNQKTEVSSDHDTPSGQNEVMKQEKGSLVKSTNQQMLTAYSSTSETESELQTRLWKEGIRAGKQYVEGGNPALSREAIDRLSQTTYPSHLKAQILWSIGFESGQHASP